MAFVAQPEISFFRARECFGVQFLPMRFHRGNEMALPQTKCTGTCKIWETRPFCIFCPRRWHLECRDDEIECLPWRWSSQICGALGANWLPTFSFDRRWCVKIGFCKKCHIGRNVGSFGFRHWARRPDRTGRRHRRQWAGAFCYNLVDQICISRDAFVRLANEIFYLGAVIWPSCA